MLSQEAKGEAAMWFLRGAVVGGILGFVAIFAGSPEVHTFANMTRAMHNIPIESLGGGLMALFFGRTLKQF